MVRDFDSRRSGYPRIRQVALDMALFANGLEFEFVGPIAPDRDDLGVIERHPQARYTKATLPLNRYGAGPFCSFKVAKGYRKAGIYLIQADKVIVYVGECQDLASRYGSGYGIISPRNCFKGGQETNCRINNLIFEAARTGAVLGLWFREVSGGKAERLKIERGLVAELRPAWNR